MTPLTRRELLALLGALGAGHTLTRRFPALGWPVSENRQPNTDNRRPTTDNRQPTTDLRLPPIGLQLYTVRSLMSKDVAATLELVAAAGVREVEFAGYFNVPNTTMRALLDRNGLTAPATHVPLPANDAAWDAQFTTAQQLGHRWVIVPWVGPAVRQSLDTWQQFADTLNAAGQRARAYNVRVGYHNHDFEYTPTEGALPMQLLLERLDASVVDLELDLYWTVKAGQDPAQWIAAHSGRFPLWHLKDAGPAPERTMHHVGGGVIDFAALFALGAQHGLQHGFIEHDNPANPAESVRMSVQTLLQIAARNPVSRG